MPLYKTILLPDNTYLLMWKVVESYDDLYGSVTLTEESEFRLQGMKSVSHQRAFLSVRKLLQAAGYTDYDMFYEVDGKPYLLDDHHVSISHSFDFVTLIISEKPCGIDVEMQRDKIVRIADKFLNDTEEIIEAQSVEEQIKKLTVIWCVKEAIYKLLGQPGVSFKQDIVVETVDLNKNEVSLKARVGETTKWYTSQFEWHDSFVLAYIVA